MGMLRVLVSYFTTRDILQSSISLRGLTEINTQNRGFGVVSNKHFPIHVRTKVLSKECWLWHYFKESLNHNFVLSNAQSNLGIPVNCLKFKY